MMEIPSIVTNKNAATNKPVHEEDKTPKVKPKITTGTIKESHATKTPYRHPNHKSRHFNQEKYQHCSEQKQLIYLPKNIDTNIIESHNNNSYWVSHKHKIPQRIKLVLGYLDT
jgi:hypothetical protein